MSLLTTDIVDIALVYGQFRLFLIELLQSLIRDGENLRFSKRQSAGQGNDQRIGLALKSLICGISGIFISLAERIVGKVCQNDIDIIL